MKKGGIWPSAFVCFKPPGRRWQTICSSSSASQAHTQCRSHLDSLTFYKTDLWLNCTQYCAVYLILFLAVLGPRCERRLPTVCVGRSRQSFWWCRRPRFDNRAQMDSSIFEWFEVDGELPSIMSATCRPNSDSFRLYAWPQCRPLIYILKGKEEKKLKLKLIWCMANCVLRNALRNLPYVLYGCRRPKC